MLITGILVFFARLVDVSMSTVRLKALIRGDKLKVFCIGFIEIIIYTLAASKAFAYVSDPVVLILYALGYACGNYVGMTIDEKLSGSKAMLMVITEYDDWKLADLLRSKGYGVTSAKGHGINGSAKSQLTVVTTKDRIKELNKICIEQDEAAYIVTLDVKNILSANKGK